MCARRAHGSFQPLSVAFWPFSTDLAGAKKRPKHYTQCGFLRSMLFGVSGLAYERNFHAHSCSVCARRSGKNNFFDEEATASRGSQKCKNGFTTTVVVPRFCGEF